MPSLGKVVERHAGHIVLAALLVCAFAVRFIAYDHPVALHGGEGMRDYLTAKHIVHFREFPAAGPWNQTLPHLGNSPAYFYALAVPLIVSLSWHALEVAFILLSCVTVLLVFLLARAVFDTRTALLASAFYAFAPVLISESATFVWQPYVMEPLLIGSVYTAYVGYRRSDVRLLLVSIALYAGALAMHLSAVALLPLYGIGIGAALYANRGVRGVLHGAVVGCASLFTLFVVPRMLSAPIFAGTPNPIPDRGHFVQFLKLLFVRTAPMEQPPLTTAVFVGILVISCCATILYMLSAESRTKKAALLIGISTIILQCAVAAGVGTQIDNRFVLPATFALAITGAALVQFLIARVPYSRSLSVIPILVVLWSASTSAYVHSITHKRPLFDRPYDTLVQTAADALAQDLQTIRAGDGYSDYGFFSMRGFRTYNHVFVPDVMWSELEDRFGAQLVHLSGNSGGLIGAEDRLYMVVLCADGDRTVAHYAVSECLQNPELAGYTVLKPSFMNSALNVFILVRNDMVAPAPRD